MLDFQFSILTLRKRFHTSKTIKQQNEKKDEEQGR